MSRSPDANWQDPTFALKRVLRRPTVPLEGYEKSAIDDATRERLQSSARAARAKSAHKIAFVFGVMPRSGTNYLERLLSAHPAIATCPAGLRELPFLANADAMDGFRDGLARFYPPNAETFAQYEWLAYAMAGYLNRIATEAEAGKSLTIIKDPHMRGIDHFAMLLPDDPAMLVLRDGRYVIDSTIRTWPLKPLGRTFEDVCMEWNAATKAALQVTETASKDQIRLVRYEDLVADTCGHMFPIFEWLGLDPAAADASQLDDAPILGSSTHSKDASGKVGWAPVTDAKEFNPTERPLDWTLAQISTFQRICGETQKQAGYDTDFS